MNTEQNDIDPASLYAIIGAAIEAGIPAEAAVMTVEEIISETDNEESDEQDEQGSEG